MATHLSIALVFAAGLVSVLSPCVLPVVPIIVSGTARDHRLRPVLIVMGLALAFVTMGVMSSLFGAVVGPWMYKVEKAVGAVIAMLGILLILDVNPFERLSALTARVQMLGRGADGLLLGLLLGVIWIPCVGPMLSSVLAVVATEQRVAAGIFYLLVYSLGFSLPLLVAAYASQSVRSRLKALGQHQHIINVLSGVLLATLGLFIVMRGMLAFGSLVTWQR